MKQMTLDQERALKIMRSGRNIFLSGAAGTGKSFLIDEYIRENINKNVVVCAPSGMAAVNIGGITIHRLFGVPTGILKIGDYNSNPSNVLVNSDIIIIDEISMCRIDVFEYVLRTLKKTKDNKKAEGDRRHYHKQIILIGDFYQLPPVLKKEDKTEFLHQWGLMRNEDLFAFNSALWDELGLVNIILKTPIRQNDDRDYIDNLNKIRMGDTSGIEWFNLHIQKEPLSDAVFLCSYKDKVKEINDIQVSRIPGECKCYNAEITGYVNEKAIPVERELLLKHGMRVMTVVNNEDYQNGSIGYVTKTDDDYVEIKLINGRVIRVEPYVWEESNYELKEEKVKRVVAGSFRQFPIKVAYAITIHKAQGQTLSLVNITPDCFANGQLYVALSRVKNAERMSISEAIDENALRTSKAVYRFYDDIDDELLGYELDEHKWDEDKNKEGLINEVDVIFSYALQIKKIRDQAYWTWTDEEDDRLREEWANGMSIAEIARSHDKNIGAIRVRLNNIALHEN